MITKESKLKQTKILFFMAFNTIFSTLSFRRLYRVGMQMELPSICRVPEKELYWDGKEYSSRPFEKRVYHVYRAEGLTDTPNINPSGSLIRISDESLLYTHTDKNNLMVQTPNGEKYIVIGILQAYIPLDHPTPELDNFFLTIQIKDSHLTANFEEAVSKVVKNGLPEQSGFTPNNLCVICDTFYIPKEVCWDFVTKEEIRYKNVVLFNGSVFTISKESPKEVLEILVEVLKACRVIEEMYKRYIAKLSNQEDNEPLEICEKSTPPCPSQCIGAFNFSRPNRVKICPCWKAKRILTLSEDVIENSKYDSL